MAKWFSFSQLNLDDISPKNSNFYTKKGGGGEVSIIRTESTWGKLSHMWKTLHNIQINGEDSVNIKTFLFEV